MKVCKFGGSSLANAAQLNKVIDIVLADPTRRIVVVSAPGMNPFVIFAPRPAAILAVKYDFFPIEGTRETFREAQRIYELYGRKDQVRLYEDEYTHSYTPKLAVCSAEFFSEIFLGRKVTVDNRHFEPLPEEKMYATRTGNIKGEIADARLVPQEVAEYAEELRKARMALPETERKARARAWLLYSVNHKD